MTELPEHLRNIRLQAGDHEPWEQVMNIMELTAAAAGEEWTSHPDGAAPVLTDFLNALSTIITSGSHQGLAELAPELARSNCPECEEARVQALARRILRETLPDLLERVPSVHRRQLLLEAAGQIAAGAWPDLGAEPQPYSVASLSAGVLASRLRLMYGHDDDQAAIIAAHVRTMLGECGHRAVPGEAE